MTESNSSDGLKKRSSTKRQIGIIMLILLAMFVGWVLVNRLILDGLHDGEITISRETTFLTEPLRDDGMVDYPAAINAHFSKGVTAENNLFVVMLEVFGEENLPSALSIADVAAHLEIDPGRRFDRIYQARNEWLARQEIADLPRAYQELLKEGSEMRRRGRQRSRFPKGRHSPNGEAGADRSPDAKSRRVGELYRREVEDLDRLLARRISEAENRPWRKEEFPLVARFLRSQETALDRLVEGALRRDRYYYPTLIGEGGTLWDAALPGLVVEVRDLSRTICARARLRLAEGHLDEARKDVTALLRIGASLQTGSDLITRLVGIACVGIGNDAAQSLALHPSAGPGDLRRLIASIDALKEAELAEIIRWHERLAALDAIVYVATERGDSELGIKEFESLIGHTDWIWVLRRLNDLYGRMTRTLEAETPDLRRKRQREYDAFLRQEEKQFGDLLDFVESPQGKAAAWVASSAAVRRWKTRASYWAFVAVFLPDLRKVPVLRDGAWMGTDLVRVAAALRLHEMRTGAFPEKLAALEPLLGGIPHDRFTGDPMRYRKTSDGFVVYSVGPNLLDDGGVGGMSDYEERDIVVSFPAPRESK